MSNLIRRGNTNPFLKDFFDVENVFGGSWPARNTSLPSVNISEDDKCFCVDVVAPGFKKENFKVDIEDDVLTISAESKTESNEEDKKRQYSRREYSHSSFTRSFRLPENAKDDNISASYKDGILKIDIPKTENPVKARKEVQIQ